MTFFYTQKPKVYVFYFDSDDYYFMIISQLFDVCFTIVKRQKMSVCLNLESESDEYKIHSWEYSAAPERQIIATVHQTTTRMDDEHARFSLS